MLKRDQEKEIATLIKAQGRFDAGETAFIVRELLAIKAALYNVEYPKLKALQVFPVASDVQPYAESIAYQGFDQVGHAKIIANDAKDLPRVDVQKGEVQTPVRTLGAEYGYSWLDLQRAAVMRVPLSTLRAMTARNMIAVGVDDVSAGGDTDSGMVGALSSSLITPGAATGNWSGLTASQIYTDLTTPIINIRTNTKGLHDVTDILLPESSYAYIAATPWSTTNASNVTILGFLLGNYPGLRVTPWYKLETAGASSVKRMMHFDRNPAVIEVQLPLDFYELPPQAQGLAMNIPCIARAGGVHIRYP
ncbi:MAG TPA: major capsid family protein, partial [Polyangia bacterium]